YTLLLLGGKNLVPLVSAAIIGSKGWRWVFWVVAMVSGGCVVTLFLFVPETFWDRTPLSRRNHRNVYQNVTDLVSHGFRGRQHGERLPDEPEDDEFHPQVPKRREPEQHVGFANIEEE